MGEQTGKTITCSMHPMEFTQASSMWQHLLLPLYALFLSAPGLVSVFTSPLALPEERCDDKAWKPPESHRKQLWKKKKKKSSQP